MAEAMCNEDHCLVLTGTNQLIEELKLSISIKSGAWFIHCHKIDLARLEPHESTGANVMGSVYVTENRKWNARNDSLLFSPRNIDRLLQLFHLHC